MYLRAGADAKYLSAGSVARCCITGRTDSIIEGVSTVGIGLSLEILGS